MGKERNPFPFFRFYPANWLESTAVDMMLPEQEGAFIHLLARAWRSHPPCTLPGDDLALARLSRLGRRWKKLGALVRAQFEEIEVDGELRLQNEAQYRIYLEALSQHEQRKIAGQKGRQVQLEQPRREPFPPRSEPRSETLPRLRDEKTQEDRGTRAGEARAAPGERPGLQLQIEDTEEAIASSAAPGGAATAAGNGAPSLPSSDDQRAEHTSEPDRPAGESFSQRRAPGSAVFSAAPSRSLEPDDQRPEERARAPSPKDFVWSAGLRLLTGAGDIERSARSFLGRLVRDHGEQRLAETIARAAVEQPIHPRPWIARQLNGAREGGHDGTNRGRRSPPARPVTANIDGTDWEREAAEADRRRDALLARAHAGAGR